MSSQKRRVCRYVLTLEGSVDHRCEPRWRRQNGADECDVLARQRRVSTNWVLAVHRVGVDPVLMSSPPPAATTSTLPAGHSERTTCSQIHLTPTGRYLYVGNRAANGSSIAAFAVDPATGLK